MGGGVEQLRERRERFLNAAVCWHRADAGRVRAAAACSRVPGEGSRYRGGAYDASGRRRDGLLGGDGGYTTAERATNRSSGPQRARFRRPRSDHGPRTDNRTGTRHLAAPVIHRMTKLMAKPKRAAGGRGPREDRGVLSARIVAAARASFAERGWAGTTLRGVAREAEVDSALVHYYFGSKEELLEASITPPPEWIGSVRVAVEQPVRRRGEAIVRNVLWVWSDPGLADVWRSIVLTAAHEPRARDKLVAIIEVSLVRTVAAEVDGEERLVRASLVAAQMFGVIMMRYIWRIEPLASLSDDQVVALVAPTVQRYLTGRLRRG